jgi:ParB family chromosome partitioning protein
MTVNALQGANARHDALADSERLAATLGLDMAAWWRPTADTFFGRLTKSEILAAVTEGVSAEAAHRIEGFKKDAMATEAEKLISGTRWLPMPLRAEATALHLAAE